MKNCYDLIFFRRSHGSKYRKPSSSSSSSSSSSTSRSPSPKRSKKSTKSGRRKKRSSTSEIPDDEQDELYYPTNELSFSSSDFDPLSSDDEEKIPTIRETLALLDSPHGSDVEGEECDDEFIDNLAKSKTSTKKWTPQKEAILCSLWEDHPNLYNSDDKDYMNRNKRSDTLRKFSELLGISGIYILSC